MRETRKETTIHRKKETKFSLSPKVLSPLFTHSPRRPLNLVRRGHGAWRQGSRGREQGGLGLVRGPKEFECFFAPRRRRRRGRTLLLPPRGCWPRRGHLPPDDGERAAESSPSPSPEHVAIRRMRRTRERKKERKREREREKEKEREGRKEKKKSEVQRKKNDALAYSSPRRTRAGQ